MGIEPFLFLAVLLGGFLLQVLIALRNAGSERWEAGRWMEHLVDLWGRDQGWTRHPDGSLVGATSTGSVRLFHQRWNPATALRWMSTTTGVRPRGLGRRLNMGESATVVVVERTVSGPPFRIASLESYVPNRRALGDPVADQLLNAQSADLGDLQHRLGDQATREAVFELLGRYPLSFVDEHFVVLWIQGSIRSLDEPIELAVEVAEQLAGVGIREHHATLDPEIENRRYLSRSSRRA